ncbi:MAG TPA: hypothetical protein VME43_31400 [Bryobacteraceae bacterium]|nr:hypothetical protein [Bryobacteraceae bacterium]
MKCSRCRKSIASNAGRCPYCGEANPSASGLFQTSTVLISADGVDLVYRSVDEVPAGLRTRLLKCTNGNNSATILIADRRGRKEIARAMRKPAGPAQRRLVHTALRRVPLSQPRDWLYVHRWKCAWAGVLLVVLAFVVWLLAHRGPLVQ